MAQKYLFFSDGRFRDRAIGEIRSLFGASECRLDRSVRSDRFFAMDMDAPPQAALDTFARRQPILTYNMVPVVAELPYQDNGNSALAAALSSVLHTDRSFRLEAINIVSSSGENANSIETNTGRILETMGFRADLDTPQDFVYVVLFQKRIFIGLLSSGMKLNYRIDYFRHGANSGARGLTRAEFKLREALEYFNIDASRASLALDIGAAPGGWTAEISALGGRVIAVDNALLAYGSIKSRPLIVLASPDRAKETSDTIAQSSPGSAVTVVEDPDSVPGGFSVLHIRRRAQEIDAPLLAKFGRPDLLLVDANVEPETSAQLASRFADMLNNAATLILTVKLVDDNVDKHVKAVTKGIEGKYGGIMLKKLPHNRSELTLFARRL